jgi:hypothetical protein
MALHAAAHEVFLLELELQLKAFDLRPISSCTDTRVYRLNTVPGRALYRALGDNAKVYLTIPETGKGKVQTVIDGSLDRLADNLSETTRELVKDMRTLDALFEKNLEYFGQLNLYIIAGEKKLEEELNSTMEETLQIQVAGRRKRVEVESELKVSEKDLVEALVEAKKKGAQLEGD